MSAKDGLQERRKHKRFDAKRGAFAVSPPSFDKLGQIKNISKGGLAFHYSGNNEQSKDTFDEVEIFSISDDFFLRKLPVKTVLDFEVDTQVPFNSLPQRQASLQFRELNHHQKILLQYFFQKYTRK